MRAAPPAMQQADARLRFGYLLGIFPRLSQSFVLQEILALQRAGSGVTVFSMASPSAADRRLVPQAGEIPCVYVNGRGALRLAGALLDRLGRAPWRLLRTLALVLLRHDPDLWRTFGAALLVAGEADRLGVDHLHAHLRSGSDCLWLVGELTGRPWSFTAHARDIHVWNRHLHRKLAAATRVVTVCEYNRALLGRRLGNDGPNKIHVIRPFLAPQLFAAPAAVPPTGERLRLVSVCRLEPKKGLEVLIDALALLRDRGLIVDLTVVGDGPQRCLLGEQVERRGLTAQVTFAGALDAAGVRAALASAHCAVLPARRAPDGDSDAIPTVLGEAMAMGLPVISTRLAGIPEIVPTGAGLLVEPADAAGLAEAIAEMASSPPEQRVAMGRVGRGFVAKHWNGEHDVQRLIRLFRYAMSSQPDRPPGRA